MEKGLSSFLVHLLIMIVRGYIMMLIGEDTFLIVAEL